MIFPEELGIPSCSFNSTNELRVFLMLRYLVETFRSLCSLWIAFCSGVLALLDSDKRLLCISCFYQLRQHRQLRARRVLILFKDVPLRTRSALSRLYKAYGDRTTLFLVLNETLLKGFNALRALSRRHMILHSISILLSWFKEESTLLDYLMILTYCI